MNLANDLLNIIGCLFENGADPMAKCNMGRTPRDVTILNNFKIGTILFGN